MTDDTTISTLQAQYDALVLRQQQIEEQLDALEEELELLHEERVVLRAKLNVSRTNFAQTPEQHEAMLARREKIRQYIEYFSK
jgi:predicted  nucleic acid-binding Zn-ribbon protein